MWGIPSKKVLDYQAANTLPPFFWLDNAATGTYTLCKGNKAVYDVCFIEVDKALTKLSEGDKQAIFGEAIYAWSGRYNGNQYDYRPLRATTVEDAKREVEAIYDSIMQNAITTVANSLQALSCEYANFKTAQGRS